MNKWCTISASQTGEKREDDRKADEVQEKRDEHGNQNRADFARCGGIRRSVFGSHVGTAPDLRGVKGAHHSQARAFVQPLF